MRNEDGLRIAAALSPPGGRAASESVTVTVWVVGDRAEVSRAMPSVTVTVWVVGDRATVPRNDERPVPEGTGHSTYSAHSQRVAKAKPIAIQAIPTTRFFWLRSLKIQMSCQYDAPLVT